jgi:hypothetical protein
MKRVFSKVPSLLTSRLLLDLFLKQCLKFGQRISKIHIDNPDPQTDKCKKKGTSTPRNTPE